MRDGVNKLDMPLEAVFEAPLASCMRESKTVLEFLENMKRRDIISQYKARVQHLESKLLGVDVGPRSQRRSENDSKRGLQREVQDYVSGFLNPEMVCAEVENFSNDQGSINATAKDHGPLTDRASPNRAQSVESDQIKSARSGQEDPTTAICMTNSTIGRPKDGVVQELQSVHQDDILIEKLAQLAPRDRPPYVVHSQENVSKDKEIDRQYEKVLKDVASEKIDPKDLYITELRHEQTGRHPLQKHEKVKSCCRRAMRDVCAEFGDYTLYWDRHDEGVFVGGHMSGKALHVDQVAFT